MLSHSLEKQSLWSGSGWWYLLFFVQICLHFSNFLTVLHLNECTEKWQHRVKATVKPVWENSDMLWCISAVEWSLIPSLGALLPFLKYRVTVACWLGNSSSSGNKDVQTVFSISDYISWWRLWEPNVPEQRTKESLMADYLLRAVSNLKRQTTPAIHIHT